MYTETRVPKFRGETASTPEMWAANFADSERLNWWRELRLAPSREMRVIRRYVPRGSRILDAGCGSGQWVALLRRRGYAAEGCDYSATLIERLRIEYPDVPWHVGDVRHMEFPDNSFDAIISWGVIEHDPAGPVEALREFSRVIRPGGSLIVTVPRDSALYRAASQREFPEVPGREFFQYFMSEEELAAFHRQAGLEVVETGSTRRPLLQLAMPGIVLRSRLLRGLAAAFTLAGLVTHRYDGAIYCVARNRKSA